MLPRSRDLLLFCLNGRLLDEGARGWDGSIDGEVTADSSDSGISILGLVSRRQHAVEPALGLRAVELLLRGVVERVRVAAAVGVVARDDAVARDAPC